MSKGNEAGTLIFNQLKTFNESVVYFGQTLEPAVLKGLDSCIEAFCEESPGWYGEFDLTEESDCWLAPKQWNLTPRDDEPDFKAWFGIDCINDNDDYWVAVFCSAASAGGQAGFMFDYQAKEFGGKTAWKNCVKNAGQVVNDIVALGFKNMNDGRFFLPVRLDASELAKTWDDSGTFEKNDDCFQPVRDALEIVAKSVPYFDALMQGCQAKTKQNPGT